MDKKLNDETQKEMSFLDHLEELRWRIIKILLSVIILSIISFTQADYIIDFLKYPLSKINPAPKIIFLKPAGMFIVRMSVAFVAGFVFSLPIIIIQIWKFISPGLYTTEKKIAYIFFFSAIICFIAGFLFAYFLILPMGLNFLLKMTVEGIEPQLDINNYISFVMQLIIVFGLVFELPVIVGTLAKFNLINSNFLKKIRPYAIIIIFIISALITPPDIVSQVFLALPLILLYEISILLAKLINK